MLGYELMLSPCTDEVVNNPPTTNLMFWKPRANDGNPEYFMGVRDHKIILRPRLNKVRILWNEYVTLYKRYDKKF